MNPTTTKQNLYIRKLNGFGQKISVEDSLKIRDLKDIVRSLKSLENERLKEKEFNLIFKGKNITENSQSTLKQLGIPYDGIIHLVFASEQYKKNDQLFSLSGNGFFTTTQSDPAINSLVQKFNQVTLKVMFNGTQHEFTINSSCTVLELKKKIASKLNLIFQSLVLSHLGCQMVNEKQLFSYGLENYTLISLKFNLQKPEKKKLQSRMVSSVTFSDENNEPNKTNQIVQEFGKSKLATSSKSFGSDKQEQETSTQRLTSLMSSNNKPMMYKSDINSFGSSQTSKAAMMFKNALHQKIVETESVVSGSFSEDNSISGNDPNSLMITVKNEEDTKEFQLQCLKSHQIFNIRQKLMQIERVPISQKIEISMQEDLFQSIDLNKSGCVSLNEIVKKMGKERAVFIYRIV